MLQFVMFQAAKLYMIESSINVYRMKKIVKTFDYWFLLMVKPIKNSYFCIIKLQYNGNSAKYFSHTSK